MSGGRPPTKKAPPFGERLGALRRQKGLTQAQFAKKLGLAIEMVNYYERRCPNPSGKFVQKAAAILGVSADELLGTKPIRAQPGPRSVIEQRMKAARKLPRDKQKFIIQLIDTMLRETKAS